MYTWEVPCLFKSVVHHFQPTKGFKWHGYRSFFPSLMHSICPRDLDSALCNPCWYSRIFFFSVMHSICPKDLNCAPYNPCGYTKFFFSLMLSVCPRDLNSAAYNPCWYIKNFFLV